MPPPPHPHQNPQVGGPDLLWRHFALGRPAPRRRRPPKRLGGDAPALRRSGREARGETKTGGGSKLVEGSSSERRRLELVGHPGRPPGPGYHVCFFLFMSLLPGGSLRGRFPCLNSFNLICTRTHIFFGLLTNRLY